MENATVSIETELTIYGTTVTTICLYGKPDRIETILAIYGKTVTTDSFYGKRDSLYEKPDRKPTSLYGKPDSLKRKPGVYMVKLSVTTHSESLYASPR